MSDNIIILGLDSGNNTIISSARNCGVLSESFYPAVYAYGLGKARKFQGTEKSNLVQVDEAFTDINGGTTSFLINHNDDTIRLGLSAYVGGGHIDTDISVDKFFNPDYHDMMLNGSINALVNSGLYVDDTGGMNRVYLAVGMPPQWYYDDPAKSNPLYACYKEVLAQPKQYWISKSDRYANFKFSPKPLVLPEGLGGYWDHMYDAEGTIENGRDKDTGVLIIDVGYLTVDTVVVRNFEIGEERVLSIPAGITTYFDIFTDKLNLAGVDCTKDQVERYHYTKTTRVNGLRSDNPKYAKAQKSAGSEYLNKLRGHLASGYGSLSNRFEEIVFIGGATEIFKSEEIQRFASVGQKEVYPLDVKANARGYRKALEEILIAKGVIDRTWGAE